MIINILVVRIVAVVIAVVHVFVVVIRIIRIVEPAYYASSNAIIIIIAPQSSPYESALA